MKPKKNQILNSLSSSVKIIWLSLSRTLSVIAQVFYSFALVGGLVISPAAISQPLRCEDVLNRPLYQSTKKAIQNEFGIILNDYNLDLIDRVINERQDVTDYDRYQFETLLLSLKWNDPSQTKEVTQFLQRNLSHSESIALRLARSIGRTEKGAEPDLQAFFGNYTQQQIARKDRILELAGFSFDERMALLGEKFIYDDLTNYAAYELIGDDPTETPEHAKAMNVEVLRQANVVAKQVTGTPTRKLFLTYAEAKNLYESVTRNPVTRLLNFRKYDPDGNLGFCFGRAMAAHLEALQNGVDKDSIRKVFVVGSMRAIMRNITWQSHVATMVKSPDGGWWVIDPAAGKVLKLDVWYEKMAKHDNTGKMRIYVTKASRLAPIGSQQYNKIHLMQDYYNDYFKDLMEYFRKKARGEKQQSPIWMRAFDTTLSVLQLGL